MPRYRKLHVKATESLDINDMPDDFTRLFWVLLPLALCREGRGIDNVSWLKSRLFPLRLDVTGQMIQDAMDWYADRGMVRRYTVDSRCYFCVPTFHKYQGNTIREAESNYPPPPEQESYTVVSESGVSQELGAIKSRSDAICNMQYADAEAHDPHPAVTTYEQLTGHIITAKLQLDDILLYVPRDSTSISRWSDTIRAGISMGWSPRNTKWMVDHFRRGTIPGENYARSRDPPGTIPAQEPVIVSSAAFNATPGVD